MFTMREPEIKSLVVVIVVLPSIKQDTEKGILGPGNVPVWVPINAEVEVKSTVVVSLKVEFTWSNKFAYTVNGNPNDGLVTFKVTVI